jgi:hypothetical protein
MPADGLHLGFYFGMSLTSANVKLEVPSYLSPVGLKSLLPNTHLQRYPKHHETNDGVSMDVCLIALDASVQSW